MTDPRHQRTRSYKGRHRRPPRPQRIVVPVVALAAFSVGGVVVANSLSSHPGRGVGGGGVNVQLPQVSDPVVRTTPAAVSAPVIHHYVAPARTAAVHHLGPHSLMIRDMDAPCYVQITTRHGEVLVQRIMHSGELITFRRHGLHVTLGNAGGVRVAVNGHHAKRGGASGQVRAFRVR